MNIVGYARFAIHATKDEGFLLEFKTNDLSLQSHLLEDINDNIDCLLNLQDVLKINSNIKDCLILATFDFKSSSSFNGESTEWDSDTYVRDVIVLCDNYQEQWRRNITYAYGYATREELEKNEVTDALEEISKWEEFYDDDFTFYQEEFKTDSIFNLAL